MTYELGNTVQLTWTLGTMFEQAWYTYTSAPYFRIYAVFHGGLCESLWTNSGVIVKEHMMDQSGELR